MKRLAAVATVVFVMCAITLASAAAESSYFDPAGDANGELDVTRTTVGLDAPSDTVTLTISVTGFASADYDGRPRDIQVYVDTNSDHNAELALMVEMRSSPELQAFIGHPIVGTWSLEPMPPTMTLKRTSDGLRWTFRRTEVGIASSFDFLMYTQSPESVGGSWQIRDHAPDGVGNFWHFTADTPAPSPFTTVNLGSLGGQFGRAAAVNNLGQVVGTTMGHGFSWTAAGGMVDLGVGDAVAVSQTGQVVGHTTAGAFSRPSRRLERHRGRGKPCLLLESEDRHHRPWRARRLKRRALDQRPRRDCRLERYPHG